MVDFVSGSDVTLSIPFLVNGEFATPDAGSVTFSVRDNSGTLLITNQAYTPTNNVGLITVPAVYNTKTLTTENRAVIVNYSVASQLYQMVQRYRLTDWFNFTCGPDDVRAQLGVSSTELPDADIGIVDGYFSLKDDLNTNYQTNLDAALTAGGLMTSYANIAVVCQTCHDLFGSLRLRALNKEQSGTTSYQRFASINWDRVEDDVSARMEQAIQFITGVTASFPPIFVGGSRTDPITNA